MSFNFLPDDKILDMSKLKVDLFADDKIDVAEKLKFVLGGLKTLWEKGDNDGYQHFLLFPQYFTKASFSMSSTVKIVW